MIKFYNQHSEKQTETSAERIYENLQPSDVIVFCDVKTFIINKVDSDEIVVSNGNGSFYKSIPHNSFIRGITLGLFSLKQK